MSPDKNTSPSDTPGEEDGGAPFNRDAIPETLRKRSQWLMWSSSSDQPRRPHFRGNFGVSHSTPDDWRSFPEVAGAADTTDTWGVGLEMDRGNGATEGGLVGFDIDDALAPDGTLHEWVPSLDVFTDNDAYIELSPSSILEDREGVGGGLHIPVLGYEKPSWWTDSDFEDHEHRGVEVLDNSFMTVTGYLHEGSGATVLDARDDEALADAIDQWLADVYREINGDDPPKYHDPDRGGEQADLDAATRAEAEKITTEGVVGGSGGGDSDEYDPLTRAQVEDAVSHVDESLAYPDWIRLGFAVLAWDDTERGKAVFERWSKSNPKWSRDPAEGQRHIDDLWSGKRDPDGDVGVGTLVHHAKEGGWTPPWSKDGHDGGAAGVGDADGDDPWANVRSLYADSDTPTGEARQNAFHVLDSREHFAAMRDSEELYRYDPNTGIYRSDGEQYVGETLVHCLGAHHTTHEEREILAKLRGANWTPRSDFGGSKTDPRICVANGVLDIETGDLSPHSPEERFVRRVDAEWPDDPDAAACPQFDAIVRDVVGDDDARVIYNFLGLAVHPGYLKRSILLLHGEGGNGKTTLFEAIEQFLGPENISNHTAHKLAGGKYATADLYGKMANISDETPGRTVRHTETLKALSGDGTIEARRPYEGHFSFTNEAVLMFAANDPPEFDDDTVSINQRLVPITCTNTFDGSRTKHVIVTDATTAAERSGVLVRAVEAARQLRNGGSVHRRTAEETRTRYEKQSNTVAAFADAALEPDLDEWETNDDLYDVYVAYCEREDLPTKPRTSFFKKFEDAVSNVHDVDVETTRRQADGGRARGRAGVVFTSEGWQLLDSTRSTQSRLD